MFDFIKRLFQHLFPKHNRPSESVPEEPKGKSVRTTTPKDAKYVKQEALDQAILIVQTKIDIAYLLMGFVIFALFVSFVTLFFEYQAFIAQSFNEYNNQVKELRDEKYSLYNMRLLDLENKVASMSGQ